MAHIGGRCGGDWAVVAFGLNRNTQAQHFTAKVERGEIDDVVEATGTINAVITVQVGSQVSGTHCEIERGFQFARA